jgi:hypothetical protein
MASPRSTANSKRESSLKKLKLTAHFQYLLWKATSALKGQFTHSCSRMFWVVHLDLYRFLPKAVFGKGKRIITKKGKYENTPVEWSRFRRAPVEWPADSTG